VNQPAHAIDAPAFEPAIPPRLWRMTRLSLGYLSDSIRISRGDSDLLDRLLIAAAIDANLGPVKQDPELQFAYGALDAPPPSRLLRPVRVNALAASLGLPYETVRRRMRRLLDQGACRAIAGGVVIAEGALGTPAFKAMSLARYDRLRRFYLELLAAEATPRFAEARSVEPPWDAGPFASDLPVRVVNRLLAEYLLRFIEGVMRRLGDPLTGLFLLEVAREATEPLGDLPPDPAIPGRRPQAVRISVLAQRMKTPPETLRRRAAELERAGVCARTPQGVALLSTGLSHPQVLGLAGENAANLARLLVRLERMGMLRRWRAEAEESAAAGEAQPVDRERTLV
jgi:DNA-binding Lrp family transcriptional regulator